MKTYYLHTIDGLPATFDGYQICFAGFYGPASKLATSLAQIRREQKISAANREKDGWSAYAYKLGYRRYSI